MGVCFVKLSLIILIIDILVQLTFEQQCTSGGQRKTDATVAKLITIGNSGRKFPESKGPDLKVYCDQSDNYMKEIDQYKSKCMKGLPKQVTSILVYSIKNSIGQLCKKDSKKLTELISSTKCINRANPEINKCYTKLIDGILGTKHANDSKKIPHICCEYFKIFPCIATRSKRISTCTENHITTATDFVRSILGNVIDLLCGDYTEGSDKCDSLGRPPKKLKSQRRTKSFMLPLVEIFATFPEI